MAAYLKLHQSGELRQRVQLAKARLASCDLCPRHCGVNRLEGELGKCATAAQALISSYGPHFGEEAPLVGSHGSGTIFFTNCNLKCVFCQNYTISQLGEGEPVAPQQLAAMMLPLQRRGCHNLNLVTPTHVVPQILEALEIAADAGFSLPLVYNCGGYESLETLNLLDGIVDIYMPDMKYAEEATARRYSGVKDYPEVNQAAVKEMHRQVGDLVTDEQGVATRGLLVRHLVLPNGLAGTKRVVEFLAQQMSRNTYLNILAQYHPCHKAYDILELARPVSRAEFAEAVRLAREQGLERLDRAEARLILRFV